MYGQAATGEGYGTQGQAYSYDSSRGVPSQTPNAASYSQQPYADTSARSDCIYLPL